MDYHLHVPKGKTSVTEESFVRAICHLDSLVRDDMSMLSNLKQHGFNAESQRQHTVSPDNNKFMYIMQTVMMEMSSDVRVVNRHMGV